MSLKTVVEICLLECGHSQDYISGYSILKLSELFSRAAESNNVDTKKSKKTKSGRGKVYLQEEIKEHFIWKKREFWEKVIRDLIIGIVSLWLNYIYIYIYIMHVGIRNRGGRTRNGDICYIYECG